MSGGSRIWPTQFKDNTAIMKFKWLKRMIGFVGAGNSGKSDPRLQSDGRFLGIGCALSLVDGWMDIAWPGEWEHWLGWTQKITPEDIALMLANFNRVREMEGENFAGFALYGGGHPEVSEQQSDQAYGWFRDARVQDGRLQFQVELNSDGRAALAEKRWKFISPYFYGDFDAEGYYRPQYVDNATLTNRPVMRSGQRPLANAQRAGQTATDVPETPDIIEQPAGRLAGLGLAGGSVGAAISAEIEAVIGDAETRDIALERLYVQWRDTMDRLRKLEAMETLLYSVANSLGVAAGEDGQADLNALVPAANSAVEDRARLEIALRDALVERAVDRGAVPCTDAGRREACRLVAEDAEAAKAAWFSRPATRVAPKSPLDGVRLPCRLETGTERSPNQVQTAAINAAANARQAANKCSREAAFDWAWSEFQQGRIA